MDTSEVNLKEFLIEKKELEFALETLVCEFINKYSFARGAKITLGVQDYVFKAKVAIEL